MKRGFKDYFSVYVGLGLCTISSIAFMIRNRDGIQVSRYKDEYMIYRPTDGEVRMYPREYITDKHLLSADHPTKIEDCDDLPRGIPVQGASYRRFSLLVK